MGPKRPAFRLKTAVLGSALQLTHEVKELSGYLRWFCEQNSGAMPPGNSVQIKLERPPSDSISLGFQTVPLLAVHSA